MTRSALLIVEPDFLYTHVGVRRVIFHYWRLLLNQGFRVSLATPLGGELICARTVSLAWCQARTDPSHQDAPYWASSDLAPPPYPGREGNRRESSIRWTGPAVKAARFDVSIITNPWLCAAEGFDDPVSHGIVYDMVPNLIACGVLNLGPFIDVYAFARAHDVGYRQYLARAERIICISKSSKSDFVDFYRLGGPDADRVSSAIPYTFDTGARVSALAVEEGVGRLLLVNILDPRKNFVGVKEALRRIAGSGPLIVDVVGRERMAFEEAAGFMRDMKAMGFFVRWFRQASDACLARLYADADVLLFPSFYEGLGLPMLEAQNHGVPVVSSSTSSGREINMNASLSVDPMDHAALADRLAAVLEARHRTSSPILSGVELVETLKQFLDPRASVIF